MCHLFQKVTPPRVGKATSRHIPPLCLPTKDTETLDGTGVGYDLPAAVIPSPPSQYNHPASAAAFGSTVHVYGPGCERGQ